MQQKMLRMEAQSGEAKRSRQRIRRRKATQTQTQTRQAGRSCKICMSSDRQYMYPVAACQI